MSQSPQVPAEWEEGYVGLESFEQSLRKNFHRLSRCGLLEHLQPGMTMLDICCGWGSTMRVLEDRSVDVIGLDLSVPLLRIAREKGCRQLVAADAGRLPFPDDRFDAVVIQGGLHHFWSDQLQGVLEEIDRVLRPGGWFAFSEPANTWLLRLYVRLVDTPLAKLTPYTRHWRRTLDYERGTYFHWLGSQGAALGRIGERFSLLRCEHGMVTLFGLARSKKSSRTDA